MRYLFVLLFMWPLVFGLSCTTSQRISRTKELPKVLQLTDQQRKEVSNEPVRYMKVEKDSSSYYIIPNTDSDGEITMNLDAITVYSKSRTLPERNGKVLIDFRILVPKNILGSTRSIMISPVLHLESEKRPLTEIVIRGALFDRVQNRNYWQYSQFLRIFRPDPSGELWAYRRFIRNPMPEGVRVDSILNKPEHFEYYYSQEVPSDETSRTMLITLDTYVKGLDRTSAGVMAQDTLRFNISSILSFADTVTRYRKKIIERKAYLKDKRFLAFDINDWQINEKLEGNYRELVAIEDLLTALLTHKEYDIEGIKIVAGSSPEGSAVHNEDLSRLRATELKNYILNLFGTELSKIIETGWIGEDWYGLEELIKADTARLDNGGEILNVIASVKDPDRREDAIKRRFPNDYEILLREFYPKLRSVTFNYDLARKGMMQDTIVTTEVDTRYMEGLKLLERRKYPQALNILSEYRDVNTAVCLLSMGYDSQALEVLHNLPEGETTAYLKAVAYSRTGEKEQGRRWFLEALNLNPQMEYRARLDPEINELLKD